MPSDREQDWVAPVRELYGLPPTRLPAARSVWTDGPSPYRSAPVLVRPSLPWWRRVARWRLLRLLSGFEWYRRAYGGRWCMILSADYCGCCGEERRSAIAVWQPVSECPHAPMPCGRTVCTCEVWPEVSDG